MTLLSKRKGGVMSAESYHNGEPVDVPDEEREEFKTRNGRTVRDGGGLKPDIYLPKDDVPVVINELKKQHVIKLLKRTCWYNTTTQHNSRDPGLPH